MLLRSTEKNSIQGFKIKSKNIPILQNLKRNDDQKLSKSYLINKNKIKPAKVVLVDLKHLINLERSNLSKTKSFTTASLIKLKNLEEKYKKNGSTCMKQSCSLEFKKLNENFKRQINQKNCNKADTIINKDTQPILTSCFIDDNESYLVQTIKYDRLLDDSDDLNMSLECIRNNYS